MFIRYFENIFKHFKYFEKFTKFNFHFTVKFLKSINFSNLLLKALSIFVGFQKAYQNHYPLVLSSNPLSNSFHESSINSSLQRSINYGYFYLITIFSTKYVQNKNNKNNNNNNLD